MSSTPRKQWNIPNDMAPYSSEKCLDGLYIVCSVCSVFDIDKKNVGTVKMRNAFWKGNFIDHLNSDDKFVRQTLLEFLKGHNSFTAMTDPNHNVKNFRYQGIISGNKMKTIGNTFVDTGLLNLGNIAKELVYIKEFASNLLDLRLAPSDTVQAVMELPVSDTKSVCATCVTLLFVQTHLLWC